MRIQTKYLGEAEIERSQVIKFTGGLPGFHDETEFIIMDIPGNAGFQILQSITSAATAFIVTNPHQIYPEYTFELDDQVLEHLQINSEKEIIVLTTVTIQEPFKKSTLNLKAPIIINPVSKRGKQYIISSGDYPTKAAIENSYSLRAGGQ